MNVNLKGKCAVVTGASRGMGKAIAHGLCKAGAKVCVVARRPDVLSQAAQVLKNDTKEDVLEIPGDVSDPNIANQVIERVEKKWGGVDILINNGGGPAPGSFLDKNENDWSHAFNQNFMSVVRMTKRAVPAMKKKKWGRIINITSFIGKEPIPEMVLSASMRSAVSAFTKSIALELAGDNITVNTILPGNVMTDRAVSLMESRAKKENRDYKEIVKNMEQSIPAQRLADPDELANVAVFLASDQSSYLTGVSLVVDGGYTKGVY